MFKRSSSRLLLGCRRLRFAGVIFAIAISVSDVTASTSGATSSSENVSTTQSITWLAAGDSYASGAGLQHTTKLCARAPGTGGATSKTWAIVAQKVLSTTVPSSGLFFDTPDLVACSGAISNEFFSSYGSGYPAEWAPSMGRFDLVTFSFGGDDLGFPSVLQHCLVEAGCPPNSAVRQKIHLLGTTGVYKGKDYIPAYPAFLKHVATAVVVKGGNVVVMGYPEIVENPLLWSGISHAAGCEGFSKSDANLVRGWAGELNSTIGNAVAQVNALPSNKRNSVHFTFVDPVTGQIANEISSSNPDLFEPSSGTRHELCSAGNKPWLNGVSYLHVGSRSFHPTQPGETAMGNLAAEVISRLSWRALPSSRASSTATTYATGTSGTGSQSPWESVQIPLSGSFYNGGSQGDIGYFGGYTVSCGSPTSCLAFDQQGDVFVYSSGTWTVDAGQNAVAGACSGSTFCLAADNSGDVFTFIDGQWTTPQHVGITNDTLDSLSCVSPQFCVTVDESNAYMYTGGSWTTETLDSTDSATADFVSCGSTNFCVVVGDQQHYWTYSGGSWSSEQTYPASLGVLQAISCWSNGCIATSTAGQAATFVNEMWTLSDSFDSPSPSVSCAGDALCVAVDEKGEFLRIAVALGVEQKASLVPKTRSLQAPCLARRRHSAWQLTDKATLISIASEVSRGCARC